MVLIHDGPVFDVPCVSPVWRSLRLGAEVAVVLDTISISLWLTFVLLSNMTVPLVSWQFLTSIARVGTMNEPLAISPVVHTVRAICLLSVSNTNAGDELRSGRLVAVAAMSPRVAGGSEAV